ncbi:M56 family metallopeptidase [Maribacter cobaltidurans]|uniref:Energy transducer TonB n=1 Tax=Maribacter cobaltidurans TaxID=1178778 RepID=A0A223V2P2_9FLAO|nr:M56 family metallopeptidase [Maribacter cobaltidurans]ASV29651.1 energy transducer TonB [Maribacter cobaltidurans]GGD67079.1 cell envelope biogenesis protein TonB [Maribacter cobaltidurans]
MIQYILECIAFQLVFLVIYDFFLKRETFFQWNRVYLLVTYVLSLILPWIKIEAFKTETQVFLGYSEFLWNMDQSEVAIVPNPDNHFTLTWQEGIFWVGALLAAIWFIIKLWRLYKLRSQGKISYFKDFTQVLIPKSNIAFSFFRSIFLGEKIVGREYDSVVSHELVHIKQWHSLDLLFFEVMRIVSWFNPLVYIYQQRITELHEFIADSQVTKKEKSRHYEMLLSQMFEVQHISFVNPFFKSSLIKKRIVMLQKSKSKRVYRLKYLVLVPLVLAMLIYTSCEIESDSKENLNSTELKSKTLPYGAIEQVPIFPGCENSEDQRACFNEQIQLHISKNFNYPEEALKQGIEGRVSVMFTINSDGNIVNIKKRGPHPLLETEVERIISRLPQMKPGKSEGKAVNVPYSIPVVFKLDGTSVQAFKSGVNGETDYTPFAKVDEVPVFPGCENASDKRACFNDKIMKHISKNFRYPEEAQENGVQGRVSALFSISDNGNIENVKLRGPDKLLEDEVERILNRLPVMVPGKHEGEAVAVAYSIPVNFKLQEDNDQSSNEDSAKDYLQVNGGLTNEYGNSVFKGKVMDSESMGIPGVSIKVEGTNNAVISDFDGQFSIKVSEGKILKFQYEGLPEKRMLVSR